jgi:predicted N-acetyltransferase YhbS
MPLVRLAEEKDVPRILELYEELSITASRAEAERHPTQHDYQLILAKIRAVPGHDLLVVEEDGQVLGTVVVLIVPNLSHRGCSWALLENLIIDDKHRGRGLGKLLMEHGMARAREAGCYKLVLTSDRRREEAHQFYQHLGLEPSAYGFRVYF